MTCLAFVIGLAAEPVPAAQPTAVAVAPGAPTLVQSAPAPAPPVFAPPVQPAPAKLLHDPADPQVQPKYGLEIGEVSVNAGSHQYRLSAREWKQLLREDPVLNHLHRRGRLMVPGIVLTAVGGTWLAISTAVAIDGEVSHSAVGALGQWIFPSAMFLSGAIMTWAGARARRELHEHRLRLYMAPHASLRSAGFTVGGRF